MYARHVGSVWNCDRLLGPVARQQPPALGVGDGVVGVDGPRRGAAGRCCPAPLAERLAAPRHRGRRPRRRSGTPERARCSATTSLGSLAHERPRGRGRPGPRPAGTAACRRGRSSPPAGAAGGRARPPCGCARCGGRGRPRGRRGGRATCDSTGRSVLMATRLRRSPR